MPAQGGNVVKRGNLPKLNIVRALGSSSIFVPYFVAFSVHLGGTSAEALQLVSLAAILNVLLQAPAGYLADRIGRKAVLVVGSWLCFIGMFTVAIASSFGLCILLGFITLEFGLCLSIGPDRALGADTCQDLGIPLTCFTKNTVKYIAISQAGGSLVGGVVAGLFGLRGPIFVQAAIYLTMSLVALTVVNPASHNTQIQPLTRVVRGLRHRSHLLWAVVFAGIVTSFGGLTFWLTPLCFARDAIGGHHLPIAMYGYLWAALVASPLIFSSLHELLVDCLGRDGAIIVLIWIGLAKGPNKPAKVLLFLACQAPFATPALVC